MVYQTAKSGTEEEGRSKKSPGCHLFYEEKKKKFALFVILNLWITAGLTISRQEPETSQGSASQLFPDNIPSCKAALL